MTRRGLPTALLILLLAPTLVGAAGNCSAYRSWNTGDTLTASDLTQAFVVASTTNSTPQCLDDYSQDTTQMRSTVDPYPAGAESLATSTAGELERLRYVLKKITGWSQWYTHTEPLAIPNFNFTYNGDMEVWGSGSSAAPTRWFLSGAGATAARDTTHKKVSTASVALTRSGTDASVVQDVDAIWHGLDWWKGRTITFGMWVRATVANRVRVFINDGSATTLSSYHSGGGAFELLTVTTTVSNSASDLQIGGHIDNGDTTAQFDGAMLVLGTAVSDFVPSGWRGRKAIITGGSAASTTGAGVTVYLQTGGPTAVEQSSPIRMPFKGVLRNLQIIASSPPGVGQTYTYRARRQASNTAITATIADSSRAGGDTQNEVEFAKSDELTLQLVTSGGAASAAHVWAAEYEEIP